MIFLEKTDNGKIKKIFFGNLNLNKNISPYVSVPSSVKITNDTNINFLKAASSEGCYEITEQTTEDVAFSIEAI